MSAWTISLNLDYDTEFSSISNLRELLQLVNLVPLIAVVGCFSFGFEVSPYVDRQTPLPTPVSSTQSLFNQDTCSPPCWFGLIVGQSTAQDAIDMFEAHSDLFFTGLVDPGNHIIESVLDLQPLIEGQDFEFSWQQMNQDDAPNAPNFMAISGDGTISSMNILLNDTVTLNTTLERLGNPSSVRFATSFYNDHLYLYYRNMSMIISLITERDDDCSHGVLEEFTAENLKYLTMEGYLDQLANDNNDLSYIPVKVWQSWRDSTSDSSCSDILADLIS